MWIKNLALVAALGVVLTACAESTDRVEQPPAAHPGGRALPSSLLGQWKVSGPKVEAGTVAHVEPGGFELWVACGNLGGSWEARRGGAFLAAVTSGDEKCYGFDSQVGTDENLDPTPAWVLQAVRFEVADSGPRLLDGAGAVVAAFAPGSIPQEYADLYPAPSPDPTQRADLDAPAPALPPGVRQVARDELLGVWVQPDRPRLEERDPHVRFHATGVFEGSDGCNGLGGRWSLAEQALLTTSGPQTLIGCENIDVLGAPAAVGLAGDRLVLIDRDGSERGRLVRETASPKKS